MAAAGGFWKKKKFEKPQARVKMSRAQVKNARGNARAAGAGGGWKRKGSTAPPPPRTTPAATPAGGQSRLGNKADYKQEGMFKNAEDTPLFSGTAQRAEDSKFVPKKAPTHRQAYLEPGADPTERWEKKPRYTAQYHKNKLIMDKVEKEYQDKGLTSDYREDPRYVEAHSAADRQEQLSKLATQYGYNPENMSKKDWQEVSQRAIDDAKDDMTLRTSNAKDRQWEGEKKRGKRTEYKIVGKEHVLSRNGAFSKKDAQRYASDLNAKNKDASDEYMETKLVEYGHKKSKVEKLDVNEKRRLLAEVGHGEVQQGNFPGITVEERAEVVKNTSRHKRADARYTATHHRAARGLDKWGLGLLAAEEGGAQRVDLPPDDITADSNRNAPGYVKKSTPRKKYARQKEEIDF